MITLITPLRRFGTTKLRLFFALSRRYPKILGIAPMTSVHYTHWSILTAIPYNGAPQVVERPDRPYLIWNSVFNGVLDPYIEGFVAAVDRQIKATWDSSYGFPGTRSIGRLKNYISSLSWPGSYAYSAYPDASVRMIDSALTIAKEHRFLEELARRPGSADDFAVAYRGFLSRCEGEL
jgi:hypothetical protein